MGSIFKPKGPSPADIARAQQKAREDAERIARERREESERESIARFASSEERKRQKKRKGRGKLIANPYGYLGDEEDFGGSGSLLT